MLVPAAFEVCTETGEARLTARGELDLAVAPAFREALCAVVRSGCRRVFVDLSAVTFMDSSGAKALVGARRHAERDQIELILVGPSRPVCRLLDVLGVRESFRVVDSA
jgi:anti-anti-sigma factor